MTIEDFSNEFDMLVQSYTAEQSTAFGKTNPFIFNEYEKSIYLTQAQDIFVTTIYKGDSTAFDSFDSKEINKRILNSLIKEVKYKSPLYKLDTESYVYKLPSDLLYITQELAEITDDNIPNKYNKEVLVKPITQDEYYKIHQNPFRRDNNRRVLRIDNGFVNTSYITSSSPSSETTTPIDSLINTVLLISRYNITKYNIKYLSKPTPIILVDLDTESIEGETKQSNCILSPICHRYILTMAVKNAINSRK